MPVLISKTQLFFDFTYHIECNLTLTISLIQTIYIFDKNGYAVVPPIHLIQVLCVLLYSNSNSWQTIKLFIGSLKDFLSNKNSNQ